MKNGSLDHYIDIDGEEYFAIRDFDLMPPFLMSIPSDTDLWMFVASSGGLTAGRVDADGSLFPYETADRLYDNHHHTGPITLVRTAGGLWEPFGACDKRTTSRRNLYKNTIGNRVVFEEIEGELGLIFRYRWSACGEFGHVRTSIIRNVSDAKIRVSILDGLRNILPYGAPLALYQQASNLVDAYKRTDLDVESSMAIFSLTSRITDRAEAAEQLRANTAWCGAPFNFDIHLSSEAVASFREGEDPPAEVVLTGKRGNYLISACFDLDPGEEARWHIALDAGLSHAGIAGLRELILKSRDIDGRVEKALLESRQGVERIVGSADGIQLTRQKDVCVHHFANVLFNNMRGGIFPANYDISKADFADFVRTRNKPAAVRHAGLLEKLPRVIDRKDLLEKAEKSGDSDFVRLTYEYLPLYFGRRHGDPSRPWNRFSIRVTAPDGGKVLYYEGNWRDIFQNWEALCVSFPGFLESVVAKFVNASTIDGFNPYRITRDGIDWEVADPDDPWSYIGYWGDHQIIYLLKFLEAMLRHWPGRLEKMLGREIFTYANVPYRIKPYDDIVRDPRSTIYFDRGMAEEIEKRVEEEGTDGKLYRDGSGSIYHVNLMEKLLVPVLAKLSSFVPGGGIWMNTQRPEWNDANNALAGNGLSVVTLCYLRRHLSFLGRLARDGEGGSVPVSSEVMEWMDLVRSALEDYSDGSRRKTVDSLGRAFSNYRERVYSSGFQAKRDLGYSEFASFLDLALKLVDRSIEDNRMENGLFHAYNILDLDGDEGEAEVIHLYDMLEGQVAAMSSGLPGASEASVMLESLFMSDMYRADQRSFMLYPKRELPPFMEKNIIPEKSAGKVPLLMKLIEQGNGSIIERDSGGVLRFNGDLSNAADLISALDRLAEDGDLREEVDRDRGAVLDVFESVFRHRLFTGRSGTMYGYEGIGCIYWHMVSKLLLAVQELTLEAFRGNGSEEVSDSLAGYYYRIRSGLSFEKTAMEYGAFPTDPYSHTPQHAGARQPGMTGQVKEEIITRFGELGVVVDGGVVSFDPVILRRDEFLEKPGTFEYYDTVGEKRPIELMPGSLAFTFCQVPVVYSASGGYPRIRITYASGEVTERRGNSLDRTESLSIFERTGAIGRIEAHIDPASLPGE